MGQWLKEAKADPSAEKIGMYLVHNGVVRQTAKSRVREGDESARDVAGLYFAYDQAKVEAAIAEAYQLDVYKRQVCPVSQYDGVAEYRRRSAG